MFFKSPAHRARFLAAIRQADKIDHGKIDPEYGAALYILTSDGSTWASAQSYIDADGIDFRRLRKGLALSHGYDILVRLAGNLFNSCFRCSPVEFAILDADNFAVVLSALQMRYEAPHIIGERVLLHAYGPDPLDNDE